MGGWTSTRGEREALLRDVAAFKAGVILDDESLVSMLSENEDFVAGDEASIIRVRSEEFETSTEALQRSLGILPDDLEPRSTLELTLKYRDQPKLLNVLTGVMDIWFHQTMVDACAKRPIDMDIVRVESKNRYGDVGEYLAFELTLVCLRHLYESPWSRFRVVEWTDVVALRRLFDEADLRTQYGTFFDQRFVELSFGEHG